MEESTCPDRNSPALPQPAAEAAQRSADSAWIADALMQYEGRLVRYVERMTGDLDVAREVVQESFLRLCKQSATRFASQPASYLTKWLFTVCRNLAIDQLRRETKMSALTSDSEGQIEDQRTVDQSPHHYMEQAETEQHVSQLIEGLPNNQQEVLRLKFQNGLSYKEISEITGHTVTNVGFMLHTAIKKLRERIQVCTE